MEQNFEPFEVVEEDGRKILRLHGTESERKGIEADKIDIIYCAMRQGWYIDIKYADIRGDVEIKNAGLEMDDEGRSIVPDVVVFYCVNFQKRAGFSKAKFQETNFIRAKFQERADFVGAKFQKAHFVGAEFQEAQFGEAKFQEANFSGAKFQNTHFNKAEFQKVYFSEAEFQRAVFVKAKFQEANFIRAEFQKADFIGAEFQKVYFSGAEFQEADFIIAEFQKLADFSEASFKMNPKIDEAKHDSLSPGSLDSIGWAYRKSFLFGAGYFFEKAGKGYRNAKVEYEKEGAEYAKASESFRNAKVEYDKEGKYDEAGEMYVREKDSTREQLRREGGKLVKRAWFWIWKRTCNYGESPVRFICWLAGIIAIFSVLYMPIIPKWLSWWPSITFKEYPFHPWSAGPIKGALFNIMTALYFSVVTFCTLGFGDISPVSIVGKFWTVFQVILGYLMFGVLITLVARKMTRS